MATPIIMPKFGQMTEESTIVEWCKKEGDNVQGRVMRKIKGGLLVDIGYPVFLPASQVDIRRPGDIGEFIGTTIDAKILKIDEERRNIVISRRKLIEEASAKYRVGTGTSATRNWTRNILVTGFSLAHFEHYLFTSLQTGIEVWVMFAHLDRDEVVGARVGNSVAAFAMERLGVRGDLGFLVRRDTGPRLFVVGTLGTACAFLLFFYGARRTTAIEAVLSPAPVPYLYFVAARVIGVAHWVYRREIGWFRYD